ncbi:uncharacterized protein [Euphorbia lathyris]|uniref:uncharacterized protein isoform X2 n=1 Tax=Euphorbia lathyris TaxID=212925 RepID=UPI0033144EFA
MMLMAYISYLIAECLSGLFGPPRSFRKQSDINRENEELKRTRPHAVSPRQLLSRRDSHCLAETTTVSPRQNANQQRKLRKERRQQVRVEEIDIPPEEEIPQPEEMANPPSIMELLKATRPTATSSLVQPAIAAASFEIKPAMIQMIQNSGQFGGEYHEDPNAHLNKFTLYCSTFKYNNVTTEDVYMTLFRFSLKDEAADWLASLEPGSLADWDSTVSEFLAKYFPPSKTAQLRSDINCFKQFESENLHLAWERFQKLMRKCPHHGFEKHRLVQLFYSGISSANRASLDTAAGGNLFSKTAAVAYSLVKELAERSAHWQIEKPTPRRGVFAVEAPSSKSVGTSESNSQAVVRSSYLDSIGHCLGEAHAETECKSEILIWIILGMDLDECDGMKGMEKVYVNLARVDPFHDPTTHLSRTRCNEFLEISGTTAEIHVWYSMLGAAAKARVCELGFEPFISALPRTNGVCDRFGLRALCERWVDSTHTFHLSFGEMTISSRDFSLLTGLRGSSTPVPFCFDMIRPRVDRARLAALIGPGVYPGAKSSPAKFISTASLLSRRDFCETDDADLAVRSFLVYTLSEMIFRAKSGKVHAGLIQAFSDLDAAASYDWAGAGLAFIYKFLDLTCWKRKDFGGYTFALLVCVHPGLVLSIFFMQVWAYERRILPSQSRHRSRVPRLPLMTRWREFDLGTEKRRTVARLLDWIDSRTLGQIKFRWDDLDFGPDYAYVTLIQEQECVLTGPCVRAWYLGDRGITGIRASHWSPGEIPVSMFAVRTMPLSVIRQDLTRRFVGREVWVHAGGRDLYLSTLLSTRDAPAVAMDVDPVADVFSWEAVAAVFGQEEVPEGSWRSAHLSDFFDGARA